MMMLLLLLLMMLLLRMMAVVGKACAISQQHKNVHNDVRTTVVLAAFAAFAAVAAPVARFLRRRCSKGCVRCMMMVLDAMVW